MAKPTNREAIVNAAIEILGYNPGASLGEIANRAGVGRATLHRYFSSRDDLINEILMSSISDTNEAIASVDTTGLSAREELLRILEAVVPLGDRFHLVSSIAPGHQSSAVNEAYKQQLKAVEEFVERMKTEEVFAHEVPTSWIVMVIDSLTYTAWWAVNDGFIAPREVAHLTYRTLLNGVAAKN